VAARLRERFRVVAMDARGHGDSSRPEGADFYRWSEFGADVLAVARRLAEERGESRLALGLGHSFGGTAMLMAAAEAPDPFERIVAVDPVLLPPGGADDTRRRQNGLRLARGARRRRAVFASREEARAAWVSKPLFAAWDPEALDLYLAEGLAARRDGRVELKCPPEVEATIFELGPGFDPWPLPPRIAAPALLLRAARGEFPRAGFEAFARRMPRARVEDLDAGHLAAMERPDLVAAAVARFCERDPA
jgi:pimeloyl-ACP methyl ester carboxylesterase